jgi:hypothetical protein
VVLEIVKNGKHIIVYVRISKYVNKIHCNDQNSVNIDSKNM